MEKMYHPEGIENEMKMIGVAEVSTNSGSDDYLAMSDMGHAHDEMDYNIKSEADHCRVSR